MKKENLIWRSRASALLGILVVIVPFLGLPQNFKTILLVILGALIAVFSFARGHYLTEEEADYSTDINETKDDNNLDRGDSDLSNPINNQPAEPML